MSSSLLGLTDRVAVITGGGTGIGAASASAFGAAGATIVIASRNEENLRGVAQSVEKETGAKCMPFRADLTHEDDVKALIAATVAEFGRIDILVNNAGGVYDQLSSSLPATESLIETPTDRWQAMLDLNLTAPFMLIREAAPLMLRQGRGAIVNMSSGASFGAGGYGGYAVAKGGLETLTRTAAAEFGKHGVRVNAIMIGGIRTETPMRNMERSGMDMSQFGANTAIGRAGFPEEIAQTALFLASDASSYITGEVIDVSGGSRLINALAPNYLSGVIADPPA
jgi:NAD(P)-dependent dehydrogenase (short-subunit alcohol dehydrogenase family)